MAIGKEEYFENDELKIYRGEDFVVSKHIKIHQPTLNDICDYGEQDYYMMINTLVSTPQSIKSQLWDLGIDYTEISPYQLFCSILYMIYPQEKTSIIFGDLDFTNFKLRKRDDDESIYLYQKIPTGDIYNVNNDKTYHFSNLYEASRITNCSYNELFETLCESDKYNDFLFFNIQFDDVIIDEFTYSMIVDYLCSVHFIERDLKIPANNSTKMVLIEDAKDELERNKNKKYTSQLKNLISAMINSEGFKYNHAQVWDMKINAFMDSVKRISKIKDSNLLLQSGYSGYGINLKDVDKKQLDWLGELE